MDLISDLDHVSYFPNGIAQGTIAVIGGAAGDLTVSGITTSDRLLGVQAVEFGAGVPTTVHDLGDEFTIAEDGKINNTGGTATTSMLVLVTVAFKQD